MDKFLLKSPRVKGEPRSKLSTKRKIQCSIKSMKGVVVIEDIELYKVHLELKDQKKEVILSTLDKLRKKQPSKEVLLQTKIGKTVNKLRKHEDAAVRHLASEIYDEWKGHVLRTTNRPTWEVMCDKASQNKKLTAQRLLAKSLGVEVDEDLVKCIEGEIFHQCKQLLNVRYRRTVRKLTFLLQHHQDVRDDVISKKLSVKDLVERNVQK